MVQLLQQHARVHSITCEHVICGHIKSKQTIHVGAFSTQWALYHDVDTNSLNPDSGATFCELASLGYRRVEMRFVTFPLFGILTTQTRRRLHQNAKNRRHSGFKLTERQIGGSKCSHYRERVTTSSCAVFVSSSSPWNPAKAFPREHIPHVAAVVLDHENTGEDETLGL